ncbi:hypothetical protein [Thomasclavelia cocleata]|uniref:hypothetical protein n=1 Tax=Thomasclavelia cocleata TaxID=69824 RepID=UPI00242C73F1|nr:hypothetical protein [Thomasclavelia cocleata]MCI9629520.1 hypothetical protein [Thomasclavelia cocleata]
MDKMKLSFENKIIKNNFIVLKCDFDYQSYKIYLSKTLQLKKIIMEYDNLFDEVYIKIFNRVRDSITRAWRTYEKGDIRSAGNIIYNLLFSNKYLGHTLCTEFEKNNFVNTLYRGRIINDYSVIGSIDEFILQIFHIPFDKRNLVANERYSISGFPCLYLANSIDGVKAELEITELSHNFFIGDFKVNNSIKYFDLTPTFLKNLNQLSVTKIKVAMLKLLLLMACSIRVNKKKSNYCSNYVIPQLVTASIASKAKYNYRCIKYLSIKSYLNNKIDYNYVFIPEFQKDSLHDTKLLKMFDIIPNEDYNIFVKTKETVVI